MPCFTFRGAVQRALQRSPGELEEVGDGQAVAGLRQGPGVVQQAGQVDGRDGRGRVLGRDGGGSVRQPRPQRDRVVHPEQAILPGVELDPVLVILRPAEAGSVMQSVSVLIDFEGCCCMDTALPTTSLSVPPLRRRSGVFLTGTARSCKLSSVHPTRQEISNFGTCRALCSP